MKRGPLVLAGGTVAYAAIGVARRRKRRARGRVAPPNTSVLVAVPAIAGIGLHAIGMPDLPSIFLKAWNFGNLIFQQISSILMGIFEEAFHVLIEALNDGLHLVDEVFETVFGGIDYLYQQVAPLTRAIGELVEKTWTGVEMAFANFRNQLQGWLDNAYGVVSDYVRDLIPNVIEGLLGDAWDVLMALVDIGVDGVATLVNFLRYPVDFVWDLISGLVESAIDSALGAVEFSWDMFWGLFWPEMQRQLGVPDDPLQTLKDAWGWIVFFATNPIDQWDDRLMERLPGAAQWIEDKVREQLGLNRTKVEDMVATARGVGHATDGAIVT